MKDIKTKKYSQEENVKGNMVSVMETIQRILLENGTEESKSWEIANNILNNLSEYDVLDILGMPYLKPGTESYTNYCH